MCAVGLGVDRDDAVHRAVDAGGGGQLPPAGLARRVHRRVPDDECGCVGERSACGLGDLVAVVDVVGVVEDAQPGGLQPADELARQPALRPLGHPLGRQLVDPRMAQEHVEGGHCTPSEPANRLPHT